MTKRYKRDVNNSFSVTWYLLAKYGRWENLDRGQYPFQPIKFVNLVVPSPCETEPYNNSPNYMAYSASGQDEPNRALWLATRAGKMEPSCPLGTTRCIRQAKFHQKPYNKSFIGQVCSVKMAGLLDIGLVLFLRAKKRTLKKELGQYPAIPWPHTWSITHTHCPSEENTQIRIVAVRKNFSVNKRAYRK